MDPKQANSTFRFGRYTVNFRTGEISTNATRLRLQEKSLRVLAALMERPGELVTREELHKRLWPDATFVDFETGLNTAVKKLRAALADEGESPNYIETIPRRGYRFTVPVEIVAEAETSSEARRNAPVPAAPVIPSHESRFLPNRRRTLAVAFLLVTGIAFAFWWVTPLPEPRIIQIYPVTTSGREDYQVRPATDGARIFFVQRAGDHYELMQAPLTGGDAQKMDAPFRNTLIWDVAPDGQHYLITGFAHRGEPSQLWSWPVTGGPPVKLGDLVSGSATYSPDGSRIAFHIGHELWVGASGGSWKRKLGSFDGDVDDPAWSPNGTRLRFTIKDPIRNLGSIWEIGSDGNGLRSAIPRWEGSLRSCCGTWTPDGKYFIFIENSERSRLWAVREKSPWWRRSPAGPFLLASEAAGSWSPLIARDGTHVFFLQQRHRTARFAEL
jgi:DNA-binding winged helix-turn-helix (wHTH) protein